MQALHVQAGVRAHVLVRCRARLLRPPTWRHPAHPHPPTRPPNPSIPARHRGLERAGDGRRAGGAAAARVQRAGGHAASGLVFVHACVRARVCVCESVFVFRSRLAPRPTPLPSFSLPQHTHPLQHAARPNDRTYASLIDACARAGDKPLALRVYRKALREKCGGTLMVYSAAIAACLRSAEGPDLEAAMQVGGWWVGGWVFMPGGRGGQRASTCQPARPTRTHTLAACTQRCTHAPPPTTHPINPLPPPTPSTLSPRPPPHTPLITGVL